MVVNTKIATIQKIELITLTSCPNTKVLFDDEENESLNKEITETNSTVRKRK